MTDRATLVRRALELPKWCHSIDLGDGVVTDGVWAPGAQSHIEHGLDGIDFTGAKVLDVGCLDGRWSFEAERRGAAEVHSIDLVSQTGAVGREQYFEIAAEILGSKAHYNPQLSVFDVDRLAIDDFDIVLFLGVYYHLKDPLLALARLRSVTRDGGTILVEGQIIDDDEVAYARFFYDQILADDGTNWWVPTSACLREWVECSYFDVEWTYALPGVAWDCLESTSRGVVRARAVRRADPRIAVPDAVLEPYDENVYG